MSERFLWVEKYRPKNISEFVFSNNEHKKRIEGYLRDGELPHILAYGPPGTGKTSLFFMLMNELGIKKYDILQINGSLERTIDVLRDKITDFASSYSIDTSVRYVLLDEADYLPSTFQAALRNMMERYSSNCRFFLTANYVNRIIPALKSRCQSIALESLDEKSFIEKGVFIVENENIEFEEKTFLKIFKKTYPDLRKFIQMLQYCSLDGKLKDMTNCTEDRQEIFEQILSLAKKGDIYKARELIAKNVNQEEYVDFYRFCYKNVSRLTKDTEKQFDMILLIRDYVVKHSVCADQEINLIAFLIEMSRKMNS